MGITFTETPPKLVDSGNANDGLESGPILDPNKVKMEPRAMAPPPRLGAMKLAAFTIPLGAMSGWAKSAVETERLARENSSLNIWTPPYPIWNSLSQYIVSRKLEISR